jgi:vacuolar-type H+-ATPase subunit C/Vma6
METINEELKRQVRYLSKKFNIKNIRTQLKKVMPKRKVPNRSV